MEFKAPQYIYIYETGGIGVVILAQDYVLGSQQSS